jgi:copper transport protein
VRRGLLIAAFAAAAFAAAAVGAARPASAHALLDSSDPAAGAVLDTSPAAITMVFTETPDPKLSTTQVLDVTGAPVDVGPPVRGGQPRSLRVAITRPLPKGTYTVAWRVVSETDGHTTAGAFAFGIGESPTASAIPPGMPGTPLPTPPAVAAKVLLYIGISLLVGAAVVGTWVLRELPAGRQVLAWGGALTFAGSVGTLLAERDVVGVSLGDLLRSSTGKPFAWLALAGTATAVVACIAARRARPGLVVAAGAAAAATAFIRVDGGHAAAASPVWLEIGLQWAHALAAASWVGGLVLVLLLVRVRPGDPPVDAVSRYSRFAFGAVGVLVVAGSLRAVNGIGGLGRVPHLLDTGYGTTLALKVSVAVLAIALGGVNRYRSLPRLRAGGSLHLLRSVLGVELAAAAGAFALTGVLTGLPPQGSAASEPPAQNLLQIEGHDFATTTKVALRVDPGAPGPNTFTADVVDFDSAAPVDADRVTVRFEPVGQPNVAASSLDLERRGGAWTGQGSQLSIAGIWQATVQVRTGTRVVVVPLSFAMAPPGQRVSVAMAPGQPDLVTARVGGAQLQAYVDPGAPAANQLHLTAFDADGDELPLASATFAAAAPDGRGTTFPARRLDPGHFVADADLDPGNWTFFVDAVARDGRRLQASFEQAIR